MMKKVVSFCLWGTDAKYTFGAFENIKLMPDIYPGWVARFYMADPKCDKRRHEIAEDFIKYNDKQRFTSSNTQVEVVFLDNWVEDWRLMLARFLPASEDDVEVMISRDCDSRLSHREAAAVRQWLDSSFLVHSMSDHPWHFHPRQGLMGGMCGFKRFAYPDMASQILWFYEETHPVWQCDQDFLKNVVLPHIVNEVYPHSDLHPGCHRFPIKRQHLEFVGSVLSGDNQPIQEHVDALQQVLDSSR